MSLDRQTISVCNQPPMITQPSTLIGTRNEYRPKCGDALQLWNKERRVSFHRGSTAKLCDPSLTRAVVHERLRDDRVMFGIKCYTYVVYFTYLLTFLHSVYCRRLNYTYRSKYRFLAEIRTLSQEHNFFSADCHMALLSEIYRCSW